MDMISYLMGLKSGSTKVELTGDIVAYDDGDGNVTITTADEEADDDGD